MKKVPVSLRLDQEVVDRLKCLAKEEKVTQAEVISKLVMNTQQYSSVIHSNPYAVGVTGDEIQSGVCVGDRLPIGLLLTEKQVVLRPVEVHDVKFSKLIILVDRGCVVSITKSANGSQKWLEVIAVHDWIKYLKPSEDMDRDGALYPSGSWKDVVDTERYWSEEPEVHDACRAGYRFDISRGWRRSEYCHYLPAEESVEVVKDEQLRLTRDGFLGRYGLGKAEWAQLFTFVDGTKKQVWVAPDGLQWVYERIENKQVFTTAKGDEAWLQSHLQPQTSNTLSLTGKGK